MEKQKSIKRFTEDATIHRYGKNYLLVIGIDKYKYCPQLSNAVKDVSDFVEILETKYGFDSAVVRKLFNEDATLENITAELRKLVAEVQSIDNVIIYFSGHGNYDDLLETGSWIPYEAQLDKTTQYFSNSDLEKFLNKIKSHHTFLISDSCFSGSIFLDGKTRTSVDADSFDKYPSRWGLTSGRNTLVSDGKAGENSPFAASLLEVLKENDQSLNVGRVCDLVKQRVSALTNKKQSPYGEPLSVNGHLGGQYVFVISDKEEQRVWSLTAEIDSMSAYKHYIDAFPNGKRIEKAKERYEWFYWNEHKNSISGCQQYLKEFPNGAFNEDALKNFEIFKKKEANARVLAELTEKLKSDLAQAVFPESLEAILRPFNEKRQEFLLMKSRYKLYTTGFNQYDETAKIGWNRVFAHSLEFIQSLEVADIFIEKASAFLNKEEENSLIKSKIAARLESRDVSGAAMLLKSWLLPGTEKMEIADQIIQRHRNIQIMKISGVLTQEEYEIDINKQIFHTLDQIYSCTGSEVGYFEPNPIRKQIMQLIVDNELEKALQLLDRSLIKSSSNRKSLAELKIKYKNLQLDQEASGSVQKARIMHVLLQLVSDLDDLELVGDPAKNDLAGEILSLIEQNKFVEAVKAIQSNPDRASDLKYPLVVLNARIRRFNQDKISGARTKAEVEATENDLLDSLLWLPDHAFSELPVAGNEEKTSSKKDGELQSLIDGVVRLIGENKISEAFRVILERLAENSKVIPDFKVLKFQFIALLNRKQVGAIKPMEYDRNENRISSAFLHLTDALTKADLKPAGTIEAAAVDKGHRKQALAPLFKPADIAGSIARIGEAIEDFSDRVSLSVISIRYARLAFLNGLHILSEKDYKVLNANIVSSLHSLIETIDNSDRPADAAPQETSRPSEADLSLYHKTIAFLHENPDQINAALENALAADSSAQQLIFAGERYRQAQKEYQMDLIDIHAFTLEYNRTLDSLINIILSGV